jgi:hypothetical protein
MQAGTDIEKIKIIKVEQEGDDGVLVTYSDGTIAGYVVEELLALGSMRDKVSRNRQRPRGQV